MGPERARGRAGLVPDVSVDSGNVVVLQPRRRADTAASPPQGLPEPAVLLLAGQNAADALEQGIAVLGADGGLRYANAALRRFAAAGDGFGITERGLLADDMQAQSRLSDAVWVALATASGRIRVVAHGHPLALPRRDGGMPWIVRVMPLTGEVSGAEGGAMLVVTDPRARRVPQPAALRAALGLGEADVDLARALAEGRPVAELARRAQVTQTALRGRIARLRQRLGCRSTAQVIGLVLSLA